MNELHRKSGTQAAVDSADTVHAVFIGPSADAQSTLSDLTFEERASLDVWADGQRGDAERGGVVDLGQWPGWEGVLARRFKERFGFDIPPVA